eukprot:jgi/Psemu1/16408/gm1.16408_g
MPRGQRPYHPFTDFTNYKHNEWEMVCKCRDFLEDASLHGGNCKSITTSKPLKCNCLKFLDKSIAREAVALYMVAFFNKSKVDQQLTIMDWLRYTCLEGKRWFFVPFLNPYEEGGEHDFIDEDTPEKHAVLAALSQTRVCRYAISVLLDWGRRKWETCYRNLEDNTTPTHGLKGKRPNNTIEFDDSTIVEDLVNFFDELKELGQPQSTRIMRVETGVGLRDGEEGVVELPPSFSKRSIYYQFCHDWGWTVKSKKNSNSVLEVTPYWDTNFPNIKIVSRSADICSKCHVFHNRLRYVRYETTTEPVVVAERETRKVFDQNDVYAPLVTEPEAALSENNKILIDASLHVKQAADQRRLPNLGATQPGDTYYMTPLTIAILGIVDCSLEGGSLDAFAYHEGNGGKGGDNVASMIVMLLKHKGWMKENEVGGELTVLMDNCGGQNKNNHVLRLANLLVEAGYFKKNLYTCEQLRKALGTNERITLHSINDGDFKHYKRLEDLFYKDLKTGTIQPDCLGMADVSVQDLQKRLTVVDRNRRLREVVRDFVLLDLVAPTGIKEIKQIELYTKWRKLVPAEFVNIICPYPGDEVMRKFKEERNRKAREQTQRQRDTRPTKKKTQ